MNASHWLPTPGVYRLVGMGVILTRTFFHASMLSLLACAVSCAFCFTVRAENHSIINSPASRQSRYLPLPGTVFLLEGHLAWVIKPSDAHPSAKKPQPWVFFAHTLPHSNPAPIHGPFFQRFLDAGIAVAGIDVGDSYGNPAGRALFTSLYNELVNYQSFAKRPCMLAQSRGGLQIYNWAAEHPEWVSGIAGIYPVVNLARFPGVQKAAAIYGMSEDALRKSITEHNPIDRLKPLADAHIPILHVHGDHDSRAPFEQHTGAIAKRYKRLGGDMKVIKAAGQGHLLWPGYFENEEVIAFIIQRAKEGAVSK